MHYHHMYTNEENIYNWAERKKPSGFYKERQRDKTRYKTFILQPLYSLFATMSSLQFSKMSIFIMVCVFFPKYTTYKI